MNTDDLFQINYDILILLNLAACITIFGMCVCRLGKMETVLARVKIQYIGMAVVSLGNGFAPIFFKQWPSAPAFFFTAWVCLMMYLDGYQWMNGPPKGSTTNPAPLEEGDPYDETPPL